MEVDVDDLEDGTGSSSLGHSDRIKHTGLIIASTAIALLIASDISFCSIPPLPGRMGNIHRDRELPILTVRSWDDVMFKRQFRVQEVTSMHF